VSLPPLERRVGARNRVVLRHAGAYALVLGALGVFSWLGRGWGYFVLYGSVVAAFGLVVAGASLVRALHSRSQDTRRAGSLAERSVRSFSLAQITLTIALLATATVARLTSGPLGPFHGGPFEGVVIRGLVTSDLQLDGDEIQLQVPANPPYTITTHAFAIDGALYVGADFVFPFKRWVHIVEKNPEVILRIGDRLIQRRAVRIKEPGDARRILERVSRLRGVEPDDWLTEVWFFRMDSPQ